MNTLSKEVKVGHPLIDLLEVNKLRRQILFHSYVWDQRLIYAVSLSNTNHQESMRNFIPKLGGKRINSVECLVEMDTSPKPGKGFSNCDSVIVHTKPELNLNQGGNDGSSRQSVRVHEGGNIRLDLKLKDSEHCLSSCENSNEKIDPSESGNVMRRVHSEGEFPIVDNLSDTLDAAWTGKNHLESMILKENGVSLPDSSPVHSVVPNVELERCIVDKGGIDVVHSLDSALGAKVPQNVENSSGLGTPFPNLYSSFKRTSSLNAQKLGINEYNPVYVSLFRDLERPNNARLLLPVGVNDTIIPVFDDEPTSIIAYALVSSDYHLQMSELEKPKDAGETTISLPLFDSVNLLSFNSFDESASDIYRSVGSIEENILSIPGSRGTQILDPLSYTKDLHARVSFTDDNVQGKVKYMVTCYCAKRFEALRRICCPSELDFIRSLSRCKKWGAQGGKSNVFFAKTLDDRFIIKQVTKTELESFIKFGPAYFKYLSDSIGNGSPTCLAKILGIYQVFVVSFTLHNQTWEPRSV